MMSDKQKFSHKDISKSEFRSVKMTGAIFEDVDLSGAKFFNINLIQDWKRAELMLKQVLR